ncbi:MAG TPA: UDP-glucose/GDP-mannose dehydrogenase family protein [Chloroflexota bacterium]|nr:UDP-glucose/GDP-mannose dehydrogenase family protein [Chloroflexota bacterium]
MNNICVVGTGYVGLVTGTCFAEWGNNVICLDVDEAKIARLRSGDMPIYEPTLEERVARNVAAGRLRFTTSYAEALCGASFAFIAVPTPPDEDGGADLRFVQAAAQSIAEHMPDGLIVINKSTVPIGTGDLVRRVIEARRPGARFAVVSNPEFLREGSAFADCLSPDRVVLGSANSAAAEAVAGLYRHLGCPILLTDLATAEMIKYASNAMLATRISFMNEIAAICEQLGADVKRVAEGMGHDRRIGRAFLDAGLGYGGSCFPKDVKALAHMGEASGCRPQLLRTVDEINRDVRRRIVNKLEDVFGVLSGLTVCLWGLAFKAHTDDIREAPALDIARLLLACGATVKAYDPQAMPLAAKAVPEMEYCATALDAAFKADAVLLITDWPEFGSIDLDVLKTTMRCPVFIDGRNMLQAEDFAGRGFVYRGMGRHSWPHRQPAAPPVAAAEFVPMPAEMLTSQTAAAAAA